MTDYASSPVQPIAQALVVSSVAAVPSLFGRGFSAIDHTAGTNVWVLTLDEGLIGNTGAVEPTPDGAVAPSAPDPRTLITVRNSVHGALVTQAVALYITPVTDVGLTQLQITLEGLTGTDDQSLSFEVILWLGVGSAQL